MFERKIRFLTVRFLNARGSKMMSPGMDYVLSKGLQEFDQGPLVGVGQTRTEDMAFVEDEIRSRVVPQHPPVDRLVGKQVQQRAVADDVRQPGRIDARDVINRRARRNP